MDAMQMLDSQGPDQTGSMGHNVIANDTLDINVYFHL
jgi:hypothetical protein